MANIISVSIEHTATVDKLNAVTLNGTLYTPTTPFTLSVSTRQAIEDWLNSLGFGEIFSCIYSTDANKVSTLYVLTDCTNELDEGLDNIFYAKIAGVTTAFPLNFTTCTSTECDVNVCRYDMNVAVCDYSLWVQFTQDQIDDMNSGSATIDEFNYIDKDGNVVNILIAPIQIDGGVIGVYFDLLVMLVTALEQNGWTVGEVDSGGYFATYANSYTTWGTNIGIPTQAVFKVTIHGAGPDEVVRLWSGETNCEEINLPALTKIFPIADASWLVNGSSHAYTELASLSDMITQFGTVSFAHWQNSGGDFFVEQSPYTHGNLASTSHYFIEQAGYRDDLFDFQPEVDFIVDESGCESLEMVNVRGAVTPDCQQPDCITFVDTTDAYSPSTNDNGYGLPNYPDYGNIVSTEFELQDADGVIIGVAHDFGYIPDADETPVCLNLDSFESGLRLTAGVQYTLVYRLTLDNGDELDCAEIPFVYPDCGADILECLITRGKAALNDCPDCDLDKELTKIAMMWMELDLIQITLQTNPDCTTGDFDALLKKCLKDCNGC